MPSGHLTFVQDLTKICPSEFADAFVRLFSFSSSFAAVGLGIVIKCFRSGVLQRKQKNTMAYQLNG